MKKAIVTGGCGFIGSHLVDLLLNEGYQVTVIDNCSTGRKENLEHQENNKQLEIIIEDITNLESIQKYFFDAELVFHLAALADIVPSIENPTAYHHSNVNGTLSVLEASRNANIKRLVYTASSSCYGIPDEFPTKETAAIRPQYPYALSKYLGEEMVKHWYQVYDLPVTSLRFFNVYGPRSRTSGTYGAVFGVFLAQKLANMPYTIVGDGEQTRDFTYVSDIANACYTASQSDNTLGEIMNVGSGDTYSINKMVKLLGGDFKYIPKRPGEPDCTFADISKIKRLTSWEPKISFEKGIEIMLEHIDYWKDAPVWDPDSIKKATAKWFQYLGK